MPKSLKTNTSVWTAVFRKIVAVLKADLDFRRVVGDGLRSWDGSTDDKAPFVPSTRPVVRLTPQPRNVDWYSEDAQSGTLAVLVELGVLSTCVDDVADLWDLVVAAVTCGAGTIAQDLVDLGAETGEIVFSDPAFDPQPWAEPEGMFFASGRFELKLIRSVTP
jgi:hypothetical protein